MHARKTTLFKNDTLPPEPAPAGMRTQPTPHPPTTRHSAMGQCALAPPFASTAYVAFASRWWGARGEST